MNKVLISVLGSDQPGILATIANALKNHDANIENISQTLLDNVFGALLCVSVPEKQTPAALEQDMEAACREMGMFIRVHPWSNEKTDWQQNPPEIQPYIVSAIGPDRHGLVAEVANVLFQHSVNITNLQAIFKGGNNPLDNLMVFEVDVPRATVMNDLRDALSQIAAKLDLEINVQHRGIFESVSNIVN